MPDMPQIYAWTETADDGYEGVIAAAILSLDGMIGNLQHNRLDVAMRFKEIAEAHGKALGHRVRLVRFGRDKVIEEIDP